MVSTISIVLWTIGALALIESLLVLIFPKWAMKSTRKLVKSRKKVQKAAFFELVFAIILGAIAFLI